MAKAPAAARKADQTFKLMLVGSTNVGKTTIARRLGDISTDDDLDDSDLKYMHSVTLDDNSTVSLTIFDTHGKRMHQANFLWRCEKNKIDAFILVFSLVSRKTFTELPTWIERVEQKIGHKGRFFLIGNKADLQAVSSLSIDKNTTTIQLPISKSDLKFFLQKHHVAGYTDISATRQKATDVPDAFRQIAEQLVKQSYHECSPVSLPPRKEDKPNPFNAAEPSPQSSLIADLMAAARANHSETICGLLMRDPTVLSPVQLIATCRDPLGRTLVAVAACHGSLEATQAMRECCYPQRTTDTADTARTAEVGWADLVDLPDYAGVTPLMEAAARGHTNVITQLYRMGANVHTKDRLNFTALTHAACHGQADAVARLLGAGAVRHLEDFCGNTPLIWAARGEHHQVIRELARAGDGRPLTLDQWRHAGEYGMDALRWSEYFDYRDCQELIMDSIAKLQSDSRGEGAAPQLLIEVHEPTEPAIQAAGPWYEMTRRMRGYAVIINNVNFPPNLGLSRRDGAEVDSVDTGIYQAYAKLGFTPKLYVDKDERFLRNLPQECGLLDRCADHDAFALCISSHGGLGFIYASDGIPVPLEDIFDQIRRLPGLVRKPKVFLMQACRTLIEQSLAPIVPRPSAATSKRQEDCLYLYSVIEGGAALRASDTGCPFISAVREVLMQSDLRTDEFMQLMPQIVDRVATVTNDMQIVTSTSTLRRLLHFPPVSRYMSLEAET